MTFAHPQYLFLILVFLAFGAAAGMAAAWKKNRILHAFGSIGLIGSFSKLDLVSWRKKMIFYLASLFFLMLAAAGPQIRSREQVKEGAIDLLVVLDVSRSMAAEDFGSVTRLQISKKIVKSLVEKLNGNRIAMVTFAGNAFEQAPLTNDYRAVHFVLDEWVRINSVQQAGSDIIAALDLGATILNRSDRNKLLLLLSDGGGTIDPHSAAPVYRSIRENNIKVVINGIGSRQGYHLKKSDEDPQPILTALEEENLKAIAAGCEGTYFSSRQDHLRVAAGIFDKKVIGDDLFDGRRSIYQIPLIMAIMSFALAFRPT